MPLTAFPSEIKRRGDPYVGWLHFTVEAYESQLIASMLQLKINSKNGTSTKDISGSFGST